MDNDSFMRRVLRLSAVFNLVGALLFLFPESLFGTLAGLPANVPLLYRATVGLFVVLFGASYAWLAYRTPIDRPLVGFGAIGKASFFALVVILWQGGTLPGRTVPIAAGDAVLAGLFVWWLLTSRSAATERNAAGS